MRRLRFYLCFLLIGMLIILHSGFVAFAGSPVEKLGRGITNVATGWLEVPKEMGKEVWRGRDLAAYFVAPLKGLAKAIGRTLIGAYDITTFIIPLPRRYEPVIEPEFVFGSQK